MTITAAAAVHCRKGPRSHPSMECDAIDFLLLAFALSVCAGELRVTRNNGSAGEKVIGQLTPGNWFGNLKRQQAPATLTATKDCLLAVFFLFEEKAVLAAEG